MMQYFTLTQPDRTRVLHYYDRLVEAKVQPSSHTYNILMQAFGTIEPFDLRAMHKVFDTLRKQPHADARVEGLHWATLINCHGAANKGALSSPALPLLAVPVLVADARPCIPALACSQTSTPRSRSSTPSPTITRPARSTASRVCRTPSAGRPSSTSSSFTAGSTCSPSTSTA